MKLKRLESRLEMDWLVGGVQGRGRDSGDRKGNGGEIERNVYISENNELSRIGVLCRWITVVMGLFGMVELIDK